MEEIEKIFRKEFFAKSIINSIVVVLLGILPFSMALYLTGPWKKITVLIIVVFIIICYFFIYMCFMSIVRTTFETESKDKLEEYATKIRECSFISKEIYYYEKLFVFGSIIGPIPIRYSDILKITVKKCGEIDLQNGMEKKEKEITYKTINKLSAFFKNDIRDEDLLKHLLKLKNENENIIIKFEKRGNKLWLSELI